MDSKPHLLLLLLFLFLFLFHPQLISSSCVQRENLHIVHALLPPTSPQQQQPPQQPPQQPQPTSPPEQQQQPQPTPPPEQQTQHTSSPESESSLDTALAEAAPIAGPPADAGAIKDICSKTSYPDVCTTSLTGMPLEGNTLDAPTALQMLIKSAVRHGKAALNEADKLSKDSSLPDFTLQNMKVCQTTYADALDDFQKAADAAVSKDMGTLNTMLSAAMTDYETCSDGFMEMPGVSPLLDYDDKLSRMTSNCLAVATLLK